MNVNCLTGPQLFAGVEPIGNERCFYCAGKCDGTYLSRDYVKDTFTALDTTYESKFVCGGCVEALKEGIDLTLVDGTQKSNQKTRGYSWIATKEGRRAYTKAHRSLLLEACLNPPEPPFLISISDSGQKHLLYKSVVNWERGHVVVSLEGVQVRFSASDLSSRLDLCMRVCAVVGKPGMKDELSIQSQMRLFEHYGSDHVLAAWLSCFYEPLTQLAVWLCPPKDECSEKFSSGGE